MQFEQASIKIQQEKEFEELKDRINSALAPANLKKFLRLLQSQEIRVRDLDSVLQKGILDRIDRAAGREGAAKTLYSQLALSDQAQIKEFYLFKVEEVAPELRAKFSKLYQYY